MRHYGIAFDEIMIPLAQDNTREEILRVSPSGKCPALHDGDIIVWDSLAIIESPKSIQKSRSCRAARGAGAGALAAEMHSGFTGMRQLLPMNMRRAVRKRNLTPEASADVARVEQAFKQARNQFGQAGAFLFGDFSAADAMFAPVANRLHVYDVPVAAATRAYINAMMALPAWQEWQAQAEPWTIGKYEVA